MKLEQFIARVTAGLRKAVAPSGDFSLPFRVVLRCAPAHVLGEFEPFVRLQPVHRVFDFREAHRGEIYELWRDKQGASWISPESKTFTGNRNSGLIKLVKANDEITTQFSTLSLS